MGGEARCALCGTASPAGVLAEAGLADPGTTARLLQRHPAWRRSDGACPACLQQALLEVLLERGDRELHRAIQRIWPLDAEAAYGALPTPLRMHMDPLATGSGVTLALVDAGFFPHPDLIRPRNRIRAWVDAASDPVREVCFPPSAAPAWDGWDAATGPQWHGLMTSTVAAGNGSLSHGLYRGLAPEADLVLLQVREPDGRIGNGGITRALDWVARRGPALGVRVVSLSLAGDSLEQASPREVDAAVQHCVDAGILVVAAAGNDGVRRLAPPGSTPSTLTVGGLDDRSLLDHTAVRLWHANYGATGEGHPKPELVAPSVWVVAPLLPDTETAREAADLFDRRRQGDPEVEIEITRRRLVTPHYQFVEGTSFATPIVAATACAMLEVNPALGPHDLRRLLIGACTPVAGAPVERQGAGALDAGQAVSLARRATGGTEDLAPLGPSVRASRIRLDAAITGVGKLAVLGSWNGWLPPGGEFQEERPGRWSLELDGLATGEHEYKFLLDGSTWVEDPGNPVRVPDGRGGFNSVLRVPAA